MKDLYKNPVAYYIIIPVVTALWPLLIWGLYLPNAQKNWDLEKNEYTKAKKTIDEILSVDPARLDFADSVSNSVEFDYASAVDQIANFCGIASTDYKLTSGAIITSGGQKSQSARISLKQIDITRFAKFLSIIQFRWASLQCENLKITKKKGLVNSWDIDMDFKYYY